MIDRAEQAALLWLLHASDNGQIISGFELPKVMHLRNVQRRIRARLGTHPPAGPADVVAATQGKAMADTAYIRGKPKP
jgi:hypothetical protein